MPRASLFLSTYEAPGPLALVCAGLERQSERDLEVLVCDDGSGPETGRVIEEFRARAAFPVFHLRQEHRGFRKCRILNEAARKAAGSVLIFLDGDCVPHRHFVRDHLEQQEAGRYLAGRRVELGERLSAWLTPERVRAGFFDRPRWPLLSSALRGESQAVNRSFRVSSARLRRLFRMDRVVDLKGCNYSVARVSLEAINGFDEEYEGYGREDTDVELRLRNLGLAIKSLKGVALQFHLWHPRREFTPANEERLAELARSGRIRCRLGLRAES
jgi:glycosyltransferase involved in cell wall biosynthesis